MAEFQTQIAGVGMREAITHKRRDAHAAGQQQGGRFGVHIKTGAQGAPHTDFIAHGQGGQLAGSPAHHLAEKGQSIVIARANGQGPRPHGVFPGRQAQHGELAGPPDHIFGFLQVNIEKLRSLRAVGVVGLHGQDHEIVAGRGRRRRQSDGGSAHNVFPGLVLI